MSKQANQITELSLGPLIFDDFTRDSDGEVWTQACSQCQAAIKDKFGNELFDDHGSGICGVKGCNAEDKNTAYVKLKKGMYVALLKLHQLVYTVKGPMNLTLHFTNYATDQGLAAALADIEDNSKRTLKSQTIVQVKEITKWTVNNHLLTGYYMAGAKREDGVKHYCTGSNHYTTYTAE